MPESAGNLQEFLDRARALHAENRTAEAVALLESVDPGIQGSRSWALIAHYHFVLQQYEASELAARKALEAEPSNRLALHTCGELMLKKSNYPQAEMYFREALAAGSRSPVPYLRLAYIYISLYQFDRAVDILNQGLEKHTGHPELMERLQYALTMDGRIQDAERIRKSRQNTASSIPDMRALLNRFEGLEREHAIRQLKLLASMEHYRDEAALHDQLSRYLMAADRYIEAIPHLEIVIGLQNRNDAARLNLALSYIRTGDSDRAWQILEPMQRYRQDLQFRMVIVEALSASGRHREALDMCIDLLEENPRNRRLRGLLKQLKRKQLKPES